MYPEGISLPGTYISPAETGFYYLQSRYYDPEVGRFICGDETIINVCSFANILKSSFAYCDNSPTINRDTYGYAIETVLDVASVASSLITLFAKPSWLNFGMLTWDVVSMLIPFVPGSYALKAGKFVVSVANNIDDFSKGTKFLTGTYKQLRGVLKHVKGIEIHHLVEKRFWRLFRKCDVKNFLSIPLSKELHKVITKRWMNLYKKGDYFKYFKRGSNYTKITYTMMEKAIEEVYKDMPQALEETLRWFRKNWRKFE